MTKKYKLQWKRLLKENTFKFITLTYLQYYQCGTLSSIHFLRDKARKYEGCWGETFSNLLHIFKECIDIFNFILY